MIVHIVPTINNEASGPTYSVVRLCESIMNTGAELELSVLRSFGTNVKPPYLHDFKILGLRRLGFSSGMHNWLKAKGVNSEVEVLHNHSLWMMPNVYPGWVASKYNIPYMVSPRGTLSEKAMNLGSKIKYPFWYLVQKPALRSVSCFHATALNEYEDIRRHKFNQPVAVVPNGVDIPEYLNYEKTRERTLLFLSRIHPKKGIDNLLNAWKIVRSKFPEWELKIVGPDNFGHLDEMKKLSAKLKLSRVEFTGPLFGQEKQMAYQQADLFVLPTYSENFGLAVAEALAAGTPAIVTKGAPWEGLNTHGAGQWIDIGVDPLVASLEDMMSRSREELTQMGVNGREWMKRDFSWDKIGAQMVETYQWMLGQASKPDWVIDD